jgi:DNA-binding NarL/FixJ family response regulator
VHDKDTAWVGLRERAAFGDGAVGAGPVAGSGWSVETVRKAAELHPAVVLMDVRMPRVDGIEATRRIVAAGDSSGILILTTFDLDG